MKDKQTKHPFVNRALIATSLFFCFGTISFAGPNIYTDVGPLEENIPAQQQKSINGTVVDTQGESIIGATISVKGSTTGTVTDIDGKFSLSASPGATITISYIGYVSQEIRVGDKSDLRIELKENSQVINEVVVVGYGVQKKVNLSGSVAAVKMDELVESRPITNVANGLAGLAAGVQVNAGSNTPGSGKTTIMIRGQGTLNNSEPLVIIDGVEGDISSVNPQDIENLSVLKDAASASIYGSRAANGVILITTKQGKQGKIKIDYNGYVSFESINRTIKTVSNYADYMELMNEGRVNSNLPLLFSQDKIDLWRANEGGNSLLYPNTDWVKETFKTSVSTNHNISLSGGSDKAKFYTSFGYLNSPGVMENSGYEKFSLRSNLDLEVKSWLKLGTNLSGYVSSTEPGTEAIDDVFRFASGTTPGMVFRAPDGRYGAMNNSEDNSQSGNNNPLRRLNGTVGKFRQRNIKARFYGTLTFLKGLSATASYTYEHTDKIEEKKPFLIDGWDFLNDRISSADMRKSTISNKNIKAQRNLLDLVIHYNTKFNKLDFSVMGGGSQELYQSQNFQASRQDLIDPELGVIDGATGPSTTSGAKEEWAMRSFFGRVNLGWADKYLLELNLRADGSSRFQKKKRWGYFPSVSAAWRIDQEAFMEKPSSVWLSNLKLRASYGSLGNNAIGEYEFLSKYGLANYVLNDEVKPGLAVLDIPNANLTWEKTKIADIGLDFGVLNNRLTGTFDYFHKNTVDILIELPAPLVNGAANLPHQNAGAVVNKGFEISLSWQDQIGDVNYFVNGNVTFIKNKLTKYHGDNYTIKENGLLKEGLPIMVQYGRIVDRIVQTESDLALIQKIIDNAPEDRKPFGSDKTPQLGDILYKDINKDGVIDDDDRVPIGNGPNPKVTYGFNIGASYKGFDFSMLLQGVGGIKMYYLDGYFTPNIRWGYLINKDIANGRWHDGVTNAKYPRLLDISDTRNNHVSDFWIQDKSYLKIRNIQFGYTLPKRLISKLDIDKIRIYGSLENFFTFTKYKGMDPEVSNTHYPNMRQAVIGLNLTF